MTDFWTYLLLCSDGSYYAGHTDNLAVRFAQHADGRGGDYTMRRLPVALVWSERFDSRERAFACERQVKGWSRAKKQALIRGEFERLPELARNRQGQREEGSTAAG